MTGRFSRLLAVGCALAALVGLVGPSGASAAPPPAAGVETYVPNFTFDKAADGNEFLSAVNPGAKTGTFTGSQVAVFRLWVFKDGAFNFEGIITFTGTVAGCGTGTVVLGVEGTGFVRPDGSAVITRDHQHTLFGQGTLPVHASLDSVGAGTTLTYTGEYHC